MAEDAGAQMVTVHGRTRMQMYRGQANWDAIREVREAVDIPLIVNGDILTAQDAVRAIEASGANGVMVGRGGFETHGSSDVSETTSQERRLMSPLSTSGRHTSSNISISSWEKRHQCVVLRAE